MALPKTIEDRIITEADEYARTYSGTKMIKRPYIAGATAEAERAQKLVDFVNQFTDDPYPEKVFPCLSDAEMNHIKEKLQLAEISMDRLAAHYGRIFRRSYQRQAAKALAEYHNPVKISYERNFISRIYE